MNTYGMVWNAIMCVHLNASSIYSDLGLMERIPLFRIASDTVLANPINWVDGWVGGGINASYMGVTYITLGHSSVHSQY